jgi:aminomethyltransferase
VYNHTYHPRHYGDPVAEYWHLLEAVTLWDVGVERQVEITGPDAFEFTNMLVSRDLTKCAVGQAKYVFITAPDGGIINDPVLLRLGENHFWLSLADSDVLLWAKGLAHASGANVQISEPDVGPLQVQGPRAGKVLVDLFGEQIQDIPYYYTAQFELDGMEVVVSRTGFSGEVGYEIYLRNASRDATRLWDAVWEAGRPHDLRVIGPCHIRRIEGGFLSWGNDIWYDTNPYEVGYGFEQTWMVDLDQEADFIGKEALRRVAEEGISRKLVGLFIDGPGLGSFNDGSMIDVFPVLDGAQQVGSVTSACYSPRLERNIGFAMVPLEYAELDTPLTVRTPHGVTAATVTAKPFIDPGKQLPKGLGSGPADTAQVAG